MLVRSLPAIRSQVYEGLTFKYDTTSGVRRAYGATTGAYGTTTGVRHDDGRTAWANGDDGRTALRLAYGDDRRLLLLVL